MSLRDHVICDSDLHVMEPPDLWERYIDPAYAHAAPRGLVGDPARHAGPGEEPHDAAHGHRARHRTSRVARPAGARSTTTCTPRRRRAGWDAESQVAAMDAEGLDLAVLYPSRGLFVLGLDTVEQIGTDGLEPEYATAIARAYNDWMKDFCDVAPDRMFGAGMVAPHDVEGAVDRGPPLRGGARLQGHLPRRPRRSTAGRGTTRPTTRCGPRSSGSTCRSRSTAAARPT